MANLDVAAEEGAPSTPGLADVMTPLMQLPQALEAWGAYAQPMTMGECYSLVERLSAERLGEMRAAWGVVNKHFKDESYCCYNDDFGSTTVIAMMVFKAMKAKDSARSSR